MRPVCGAIVACNNCISHFLSMILKPVIKSAQEVCECTEDLLSLVEGCNETNDLTTSIIGSMDVTAFYPSIDVEFAVNKCIELINESYVEFQNVDLDELSLFLMLMTSKESLQSNDVLKFCPTRKSKGRTQTLTASGINNKPEKRWSGWTKTMIMIIIY